MNDLDIETKVVISKDYLNSLLTEIKELKEENAKLVEDSAFLCALDAAGVDNWEGYSRAHEILEEWQQESD